MNDEQLMGYDITLRDYFAAAALTGLLAQNSDPQISDIAHDAYVYADALIKEREKES